MSKRNSTFKKMNFRGYGEAEALSVFQAGWSGCIRFFSFFIWKDPDHTNTSLDARRYGVQSEKISCSFYDRPLNALRISTHCRRFRKEAGFYLEELSTYDLSVVARYLCRKLFNFFVFPFFHRAKLFAVR
jgi:hypothetical protein